MTSHDPRRPLDNVPSIKLKLGFVISAAVAATVGLSAAVGTIEHPASSHAPTRSAVPSAKLRFPDQELRMLQRASQARSHPHLAL